MEGKFFKIRSALNGLVLSIEGGNPSPAARVSMYADAGGPNELWYEDWITGTVHSKLNDYCLEISSVGACVNPYHPDEPNQRWTVADDRVNHRENPTLVLDIQKSNPNEGSDLCAYAHHGGPNQMFTKDYTQAHDCAFYIRSKMHGKVMDIDDEGTKPGTKVIMYDQHKTPKNNQLFYEDKYGTIHTMLNDFALDFDDGKIRINPYDPLKESQQWVITGDIICLKNDRDKVIDIYDEDSWNGAYLVCYKYHGKNNQRWTFEYI